MKFVDVRLAKTFAAFYQNRRTTTVTKTALYSTLSWLRWIQSAPSSAHINNECSDTVKLSATLHALPYRNPSLSSSSQTRTIIVKASCYKLELKLHSPICLYVVYVITLFIWHCIPMHSWAFEIIPDFPSKILFTFLSHLSNACHMSPSLILSSL
jgi:hypothetical protein